MKGWMMSIEFVFRFFDFFFFWFFGKSFVCGSFKQNINTFLGMFHFSAQPDKNIIINDFVVKAWKCFTIKFRKWLKGEHLVSWITFNTFSEAKTRQRNCVFVEVLKKIKYGRLKVVYKEKNTEQWATPSEILLKS